MRLRRGKVVAALATAAVVALTAVSVTFGASGAGGTLTGRVAADYQTWDFQSTTIAGSSYASGGYDRLVINAGGKIYPYLASSWKVKPKSVTFTLRRDAKCANGNKITPKVVADSFQRLLAVPKVSVNLVQLIGPGPLSTDYDMKKWTFTLKSQTPFSAMLLGTADVSMGILCPAGLKNPSQLQTDWLGSGPYGLVSARRGDQVVMKLRHDWTWGPVINGHQVTWKDLPETQVWKLVNNQTTATNLLITGDIDIISFGGGSPDFDRLKNDSRFKVTTNPSNWPFGITYNFLPNRVTSNEALRKALSTSIDTNAFNQVSTGGYGTPVTSFLPKGRDCYDPNTVKLYPSGGVAKAKQILTQAGFTGVGSNGGLKTPNGKPVKLDVLVAIPFFGANTGELMMNAYSQLGADVNLRNTPQGQVGAITFRGDFDVSLTGSPQPPSTPLLSAGQFYGKPVTQSGVNFFGPAPAQDPKWTGLWRIASQRPGTCKYWNQLQEYTLDHAMFLPITLSPTFVVYKKNIDYTSGAWTFDPLLVRLK